MLNVVSTDWFLFDFRLPSVGVRLPSHWRPDSIRLAGWFGLRAACMRLTFNARSAADVRLAQVRLAFISGVTCLHLAGVTQKPAPILLHNMTYTDTCYYKNHIKWKHLCEVFFIGKIVVTFIAFPNYPLGSRLIETLAGTGYQTNDVVVFDVEYKERGCVLVGNWINSSSGVKSSCSEADQEKVSSATPHLSSQDEDKEWG